MYDSLKPIIEKELASIKEQGLYKDERIISSSQGREISVGGKKVINFCANNYLGLANREEIISAAKSALEKWGYGLSSVRFICGTQEIHKELEKKWLILWVLKTLFYTLPVSTPIWGYSKLCYRKKTLL